MSVQEALEAYERVVEHFSNMRRQETIERPSRHRCHHQPATSMLCAFVPTGARASKIMKGFVALASQRDESEKKIAMELNRLQDIEYSLALTEARRLWDLGLFEQSPLFKNFLAGYDQHCDEFSRFQGTGRPKNEQLYVTQGGYFTFAEHITWRWRPRYQRTFVTGYGKDNQLVSERRPTDLIPVDYLIQDALRFTTRLMLRYNQKPDVVQEARIVVAMRHREQDRAEVETFFVSLTHHDEAEFPRKID